MAYNQNSRNLLLETIDNEVPIIFELITLQKRRQKQTAIQHSKNLPSIIRANHSPAYLSERFTNHLQPQV